MTSYEIASLIISLIALGLSLYAAINTYYEKHIKTQIHLRWVNFVSNELRVCLLITNMASRPSTLTKVCLHYNDDVTESTWFASKINETYVDGKPISASWADYTPINLPPRSSKTVVLAFQYLNNFQPACAIDLSFVVNGTEFEKTMVVKKFLDNQELNIAMEHRAQRS